MNGGVESPNLQFCLSRAVESGTPENTESRTYTTCLVPAPPTGSGSIEDLTGSSSIAYKMLDDCLNGKTAILQVNPSFAHACADVTSLLGATTTPENNNTAGVVNNARTRSRSLLRGGDDAKKRVLQTTNE